MSKEEILKLKLDTLKKSSSDPQIGLLADMLGEMLDIMEERKKAGF